MSACLWADIDTYLKTAILADMGAAGLYPTPTRLHIPADSILVGETFDPDHQTRPCSLIRGMEAQLSGEFEGVDDVSNRIFGMVYPYELIVVSDSDIVDDAKEDAQELYRRLREMMRTRYAFGGLQSSDGEIVVQVQMTAGRWGVWGRSGTNTGAYMAGALLGFDVFTEI